MSSHLTCLIADEASRAEQGKRRNVRREPNRFLARRMRHVTQLVSRRFVDYVTRAVLPGRSRYRRYANPTLIPRSSLDPASPRVLLASLATITTGTFGERGAPRRRGPVVAVLHGALGRAMDDSSLLHIHTCFIRVYVARATRKSVITHGKNCLFLPLPVTACDRAQPPRPLLIGTGRLFPKRPFRLLRPPLFFLFYAREKRQLIAFVRDLIAKGGRRFMQWPPRRDPVSHLVGDSPIAAPSPCRLPRNSATHVPFDASGTIDFQSRE